jgi:hypothetical protein
LNSRKLNAAGKGVGDFFVLTSPTKNDQVKFVSGDAEIKALADLVKSTNLDVKFPDPSSVRALRRATVKCGTAPPPVIKGKPVNRKTTNAKELPTASKAGPPAPPELLPGPCTVELQFSDTVRSID